MALTVKFTRTVQLYPRGVFLQWEINDADRFGDYAVEIYRGQSADGPWEHLGTFANAYNYTDVFDVDGPGDATANTYSLERALYYRLRVIPPPGLDEAVTVAGLVGPESKGRQAGIRRKILRDETVMLSKLNGSRVAICKRKRWGPRCPDCFDPYTREVLRGDCLRCYGTGFVGGYHNPVITWARRTPKNVAVTQTESGKVELSGAQIMMLDFPSVQADDLIVFLDENSRYLVRAATGTELRIVQVHQEITATELSHAAIEYRLPVDPLTSVPLF
jgi:hypothetical protein